MSFGADAFILVPSLRHQNELVCSQRSDIVAIAICNTVLDGDRTNTVKYTITGNNVILLLFATSADTHCTPTPSMMGDLSLCSLFLWMYVSYKVFPSLIIGINEKTCIYRQRFRIGSL